MTAVTIHSEILLPFTYVFLITKAKKDIITISVWNYVAWYFFQASIPNIKSA